MDFHITLAGLSHRTASIDERERLNPRQANPGWLPPLSPAIRESFALSTCNRVELIAVGDAGAGEEIKAAWAAACQCAVADVERHLYIHQDIEAVRHVFEVASSLDSMVLGEPQILGQMKAAYRSAVDARSAGPILSRLMHKAFSTAKRVRHETAIAASAVSISYAAVELAKRIFGSMPSHRAMLIGAGEMAELAAAHLLQAGIDEILVTNRTWSRAEDLAARFRGRALPFEDLIANLAMADIIISSTSSQEAILNAAHVSQALKARRNRPMFFIDIAVPRDIDPDVNALDNAYLYDIDDLKEVVEENMAARREEAAAARAIIAEEIASFAEWLRNLDARPTIMDIIKRGEEAAAIELARALRRAGPITPQARAAMERLAASLVKKLNHDPLMYLKRKGMGDPRARISAARSMFNLDHADPPRRP